MRRPMEAGWCGRNGVTKKDEKIIIFSEKKVKEKLVIFPFYSPENLQFEREKRERDKDREI